MTRAHCANVLCSVNEQTQFFSNSTNIALFHFTIFFFCWPNVFVNKQRMLLNVEMESPRRFLHWQLFSSKSIFKSSSWIIGCLSGVFKKHPFFDWQIEDYRRVYMIACHLRFIYCCRISTLAKSSRLYEIKMRGREIFCFPYHILLLLRAKPSRTE